MERQVLKFQLGILKYENAKNHIINNYVLLDELNLSG